MCSHSYPLELPLLRAPMHVGVAGAIWVQAMGYQTAGLVVSQIILVGVCIFKASFVAASVVAISLAITT